MVKSLEVASDPASHAQKGRGTDSFTFKANDGGQDSAPATATVTVNAQNDTPVALEDLKTTDEDTSVVIAFLGNDSGLGDGVASLEITSGPAATSGTAGVNADKSVTFTPAANWTGSHRSLTG